MVISTNFEGGFLPSLDNFSLSSRYIHSKKNCRGEEGLRRGSMRVAVIGGARAPPAPPQDPPLSEVLEGVTLPHPKLALV